MPASEIPYTKRELQLFSQSVNNRANKLTQIIRICTVPEEKKQLLNLQTELRALSFKTRANIKILYPNPEGTNND